MRADPSIPRAEMLLLSSEQVSRQRVADAGIRTCLSKPVRHLELHDALLAALGPRPHADPRQRTAGAASLGLRVLVVEDNAVNQLVATGLLEHLGCTVDIANDGAAAVERLTGEHGYAAVLMDCRMPTMDGFDATRLIRSREPAGRRVPIIAMTASALEGERERCLAAGMDDYLTKPVDAAEVERALRTWTDLPPVAAPRPRPVEGSGPTGVLDHERVEMLAALVKDGTSFFERTAASFMGRVGGQVLAIRAAVERGEPHALLTTAHQLKGSALNLGLPRVATVAERLESIGADGSTEGTAPLLDALTTEIDLAVTALQQATAAG